MHKLHFESLRSHVLAHLQVVLVDHLNRDVNSLTSLLKLHAHLIDTINDALAALLFNETFDYCCYEGLLNTYVQIELLSIQFIEVVAKRNFYLLLLQLEECAD